MGSGCKLLIIDVNGQLQQTVYTGSQWAVSANNLKLEVYGQLLQVTYNEHQ